MNTIKNMQAFTRLIGYCTGYGGKYNPGRQTLQVGVCKHPRFSTLQK